MPLQATSGAASYDAFGGGVAAVPNYIEECFSAFLYTGNGSTQTITNGIDLSTKGGMTWLKCRSAVGNNFVFDTTRGAGNYLRTNLTNANFSDATTLSAFNSNGFSLGSNAIVNTNAATYASWTFRKQPKFFDVQTFTYPLSGSITVNHSLGSTPGCIFVKATDGADNWYVYHRMMNNGTNPSNYYMLLNSTGAQVNNFASWITVGSTSITFPSGALNPGSNFVMYLFAHDAGGFGLTGTDNVISCGSFTQASGGTTVNLGYEPQLVMVKCSSAAGNWFIFDNMRGNTATLYPNLSNAEGDQGAGSFQYNATGFTMADYITGSVGSTLIYIAIRRGPMKVPTSGTSVFAPVAYTGTGTTKTVTTGFVTDLVLGGRRNQFDEGTFDRLRGNGNCLVTSNPNAESGPTIYDVNKFDIQDGFGLFENFNASLNAANQAIISWNFKRAPNFFDVVCYTGTGSARTINHNLGVAPELIITKRRNSATDWYVYCQYVSSYNTAYTQLNATNQFFTNGAIAWNATSTTYNASTFLGLSTSGGTYVSYLFATCAGVSKVGSYTGTGTTLQVNCGFTGGARFVMIKRTDSGGDWYVWDSARGIVAGNDPYLLMNSSAAEVTSTDYVDTYSAGFEISSTAPAAINASGGTFIFLAIA